LGCETSENLGREGKNKRTSTSGGAEPQTGTKKWVDNWEASKEKKKKKNPCSITRSNRDGGGGIERFTTAKRKGEKTAKKKARRGKGGTMRRNKIWATKYGGSKRQQKKKNHRMWGGEEGCNAVLRCQKRPKVTPGGKKLLPGDKKSTVVRDAKKKI